MITRQIELSLDTARRWYEQGGELKDMALGVYSRQELAGGRLPKTWDEYCEQLEKNESVKVKVNIQLLREALRLMMDYTYADKHVAMVKLHILRDKYRGGWKPDWCDDNDKWIVDRYFNFDTNKLEIKVAWGVSSPYFLSFQTEKLANEFLTNFRELIEQAGDLI